LATLMVMLVTW